MSVYIKPCAKCRRTRSVRTTVARKRKACLDCRWIAIAPPSLRRKSLGVFATKLEAESAVNEAVLNAERGIDLAPSGVKVKDVVDRYLANREGLGRGAKTMEEYRRTNALYIAPRLGDLNVAKLRAAHVGDWIGILMNSRVASS